MRLTENFTLEEFAYSQTATRKQIDNTPSGPIIKNIKELCVNILQPLRDKLKKPVIITSGYRSEALNIQIGGALNSQHCLGEAADIIVPGVSPVDLYAYILRSDLDYDQIILEFNEWVHISYSKNIRRHAALIARHIYGGVKYQKFMGVS